MPTLERAAADRDRVIERRKDLEISTFGRGAKAYISKGTGPNGTDQMLFEAPASSTVADRMGDSITPDCELDMARQAIAHGGMTIWLNHSYKLPEDVFGSVTKAWLADAIDDEQGACQDLWFQIVVDPDSPRAIDTFKKIQNGRRFGLSVGMLIKEYKIAEHDSDDWWPPIIIEAVDLLETSVVGIPANQRAYIDGVAKSMRKALNMPNDPKTAKTQRELLARGVTRGAETENDPQAEPTTTPTTEPATTPEEKPADDPKVEPATEPVTDPPADPAKTPSGVPSYSNTTPPTTKAGKALSAANVAKVKTAIGHVTDAMAHGACTDSMNSMTSCKAVLDDLLPDEETDDDDVDEQVDYQKAARLREIKDLEALRDTALADAKAALKMCEELAVTRDVLMQVVDRLKATPMGRATRAYAGSGPDRDRLTDPNARARSLREIGQSITLSGAGANDPRTRSLTA